ncbi:hypothetical protein LZF95_10730 [Algoriphagus sp. AGSA1]|uniref:hypothetical protein n=1 Tax=Algoriphagus sp. AGSA1 TaxID=2907213 RepID=UPI001F1F1FAE|nr:hypothetical protein [Algoriphagus sp. AGSA1]MCE7055151.1 hypothetical protein [Algoriphagus sp. AGSA1]
MKKMMILTLAVLGMVLGSFAVVQPAMANMNDPCTHFEDEYGCDVADCGDCIAWACDNEEQCADGDCHTMTVCT